MNKQQKEVLQYHLKSEKQVIEQLKNVYKQAAKECEDKIKLLASRSDLENLQSVVYQKQYQEALKKQLDGIADTLHTDEFSSIAEYLTKSYEDGFIGNLYDLHGQGLPFMFPVNQEQVVQAIQTDTKLSKGLYSKLGEDVSTLKKSIQSELSRGIATGSSWLTMASEIAYGMNTPFNKALNRSILIARTEGHRIQNQSALNCQKAAKDNGADIVKQWDATLDGRTRPGHGMADGQIKELDETFTVDGESMEAPGIGGSAKNVCNCRCALLQRARWALDEEELETLKERAEFFGLDKTKDFEEFKDKYIEATTPTNTMTPKPKAEYLTEKKLKQKIADADAKLEDLEKLPDSKGQIEELELQKADWQDKLDTKLYAKQKKVLIKGQKELQDQVDGTEMKSYSGIWKDDATTSDYASKMHSIQSKKDYFEKQLLQATDVDEMEKWKKLYKLTEEFEADGKKYYNLQQQLHKIKTELTKLKKGGTLSSIDDIFSQERKDAAYWFTDKNGGVKGADDVLRQTSGEVWKSASDFEKHSIYDYTSSYHKFNEPLRGIEYGTNKFLGVGNVNLDEIGINYAGYAHGQVKRQIDAMTSIIERSSYSHDMWVQRGCDYRGMDKFFGIDLNDFDLPEEELVSKLSGSTPTEYAFLSTGVSKGKGFSGKPIIMNIYAPSGTKMMYAEPFSAFGNGSGLKWDGSTTQTSFGTEAEMILQRGTQFKVTKVHRENGKIYIDMEVIGQGAY